MMRSRVHVWVRRLLLLAATAVLCVLFVAIPVGGSFLITNLRFPGRAPELPESLAVQDVEFESSDGIQLRGWWTPQETSARGTIIFLHGLNRSREEMVDRAREAHARGFSALLFDLRNHGSSADAYTTLGVRESLDACAAARFVRSQQPDSAVVLWGVSLGASTALLGASCAEADAVISDSSFLSFEETVKHHFRQIFRLPSFPIADLLILITRLRMDFALDDGDVESAVLSLREVPILFVAGGQDWRMPPELARRLMEASSDPRSELLVIPEAGHGRAYLEDPESYLQSVTAFLDEVLP